MFGQGGGGKEKKGGEAFSHMQPPNGRKGGGYPKERGDI